MLIYDCAYDYDYDYDMIMILFMTITRDMGIILNSSM